MPCFSPHGEVFSPYNAFFFPLKGIFLHIVVFFFPWYCVFLSIIRYVSPYWGVFLSMMLRFPFHYKVFLSIMGCFYVNGSLWHTPSLFYEHQLKDCYKSQVSLAFVRYTMLKLLFHVRVKGFNILFGLKGSKHSRLGNYETKWGRWDWWKEHNKKYVN